MMKYVLISWYQNLLWKRFCHFRYQTNRISVLLLNNIEHFVNKLTTFWSWVWFFSNTVFILSSNPLDLENTTIIRYAHFMMELTGEFCCFRCQKTEIHLCLLFYRFLNCVPIPFLPNITISFWCVPSLKIVEEILE